MRCMREDINFGVWTAHSEVQVAGKSCNTPNQAMKGLTPSHTADVQGSCSCVAPKGS